jgi:hypothetical protein
LRDVVRFFPFAAFHVCDRFNTHTFNLKPNMNNKYTNKHFRQKRKLIRGMEKSKKSHNQSNMIVEPLSLNVRSELKYIDTSLSTTLTNTGVWTKISLPAQGNTAIQRIADRARIVNIEFNNVLYCGGIDHARIILIQTKGLFTTPPVTTDLLQYAAPTSPIAYNAANLYKVVFDKLITMVPGGDTQVRNITCNVRAVLPELRFISGSTNVYDGQLYLLYLCTTNANITSVGYFRTWFEDGN